MRTRGNQGVNWSKVIYSQTRLGGGTNNYGVSFPGGLDLTTPTLALQPGALKDMLNFECVQTGGYGRIAGYERFDGKAAPSNAQVTIVQVTAFTNVPTVGQTLTQAVSGATGQIIAVNSTSAPLYVALTLTTGTFDATHNVLVGATPIGATTATTANLTTKVFAQYLALAANVYRALIGAVPGSGSLLGVVGQVFSTVDNVYAFRNNALGTAVDIYKKSAAGWVAVPLYKIVEFTAGAVVIPLDGETLTQGAVSSTVKRVMWRTGTFAAGSATGALVITTPSGGGGNFAAGAAVLSGGATVNLSGVQTSITILPGGKYEFIKANFTGSTNTKRIYGADGVNKAFEFDGDVYAPITTGLALDSPKHIAYHKNHLFLSKFGSALFSGPGLPFKYTATDGAGEIATGDDITDMVTMPGMQNTATLAVFQATNTGFIYGTSITDFVYTSFNSGVGAIGYSAQNLFDCFALDPLGVINLQTSLNYGNFASTTLTSNILPFVVQERTKVSASCLSRDKSQYRVFFSDGYSLWITMINKQYIGAAVVNFPNPVSCVDNTDLSNSSNAIYFGSSDGLGYVYQMDMGTSFDGTAINAFITLAWDAFKTPRILKRYRAASIEMQGSAYAEISFGYQIGYGSTDFNQPISTTYPSNFAGAPLWDSFVWDDFYWDGRTLFPTEVVLDGTAENIQVTMALNVDYVAAFTINSVIYHYTPRRGKRV